MISLYSARGRNFHFGAVVEWGGLSLTCCTICLMPEHSSTSHQDAKLERNALKKPLITGVTGQDGAYLAVCGL